MRMSARQPYENAPCALLDDRRDFEQLEPDLAHRSAFEFGAGKEFANKAQEHEGQTVQKQPEAVGGKPMAARSS